MENGKVRGNKKWIRERERKPRKRKRGRKR